MPRLPQAHVFQQCVQHGCDAYANANANICTSAKGNANATANATAKYNTDLSFSICPRFSCNHKVVSRANLEHARVRWVHFDLG